MELFNKHSTTMQAVFIEMPVGQLMVKDTEIPIPGRNEVLVKIDATSINPSDIGRIKGALAGNDIDSYIPGIEGSGTVVSAGKGLLPHLWLGKRVACTSVYRTSGTWAEYMVTSAAMCFPVSRKVSDEQAAMSLVNPLTAIALFDIIKRGKHKAIINTAAGSALGRIIELLGNHYQIPVINIVRNRNHLEQLKASGSKYVLDSSDGLFLNYLFSLVRELKATLLLDAVCGKQLYDIINVLPYNSSVILYGNLSEDSHVAVNPSAIIANKIQISGLYLGNVVKENNLFKNIMNVRRVSKLFQTDLEIKIQNKFPLNMAQVALETYIKNMSAGKVLLIPHEHNK